MSEVPDLEKYKRWAPGTEGDEIFYLASNPAEDGFPSSRSHEPD